MMWGRSIARRGFTLLELTMASGALKAADRITTQERLNTIKLALDSFAKTYGYLPCPAGRTRDPSSNSFGLEERDSSALSTCIASTGVILNGGNWFGMVPVRTLGLPNNYAGDAWGNKFDYAVADAMKTEPTAYLYQSGSLAIYYGDRTNKYIQTTRRSTATMTSVADNGSGAPRVSVTSGAPATGTIVYMGGSVYKGSYSVTNISTTQFDLVGATYSATDAGNVDWQDTSSRDAAYVVVSHGPDGRGAYPVNSGAIPANKLCNTSATVNSSPPPCTSNATTTCIDIENCNDDQYFFDTAYNDGSQPSTYFDDYIVWGSNAQQRTPVNNTLYTACPVGTSNCESWCATCTVNYPGGGATIPPASITSGAFLYKKVLTSDATSCSATCFWGGTTATGFIRP